MVRNRRNDAMARAGGRPAPWPSAARRGRHANRAGNRGGLWLLVALAIGAGALSLAYAQSGGGYSLNLNSPVAFPVDI